VPVAQVTKSQYTGIAFSSLHVEKGANMSLRKEIRGLDGGWVVNQTACHRNHTWGTQLSTPPAVKCKYSKIPII